MRYHKMYDLNSLISDFRVLLAHAMLKLTKKADYGLIALKHLTIVRPRSASAKDIADRYGVPSPVLSKVLQKLARGGFLTSEHGTNGGYRLSRDPHSISALDVIRAIDGPVFLTSCFADQGDDCQHQGRCNIRDPLRRVHTGILNLLDGLSMAELARDSEPATNGISISSSQPILSVPNLTVLNP